MKSISVFSALLGLGSTALAFGNLAASRWTTSRGIPFFPALSTRAGGTSLKAAASIVAPDSTTISKEELEKTLSVTHPAYEVVSRDVVAEYNAYCTLLRHKKSGAELFSVSTDDDNKAFAITFRTPPEDSRGVAHILEHSVLCGSRKYTTKAPFVELLKGSLKTFLNAITFPDRTSYVIASQNTQDFYNLLNVYTDAVFHPRAVSDPMVHSQEGWHLELENKDDPLIYKGVVYNEMKGVYSSPDHLLRRSSQRSLFPDTTYAVESGGDPAEIPKLSFEQFADFHRKFYHPSNSRIFFAGDDDVYTRLELMDEYLKEYDALPEAKKLSQVEWQTKRFTEPQRERYPYPSGADQPDTHMINVNWLLNDKPLSLTDQLTHKILNHLLMGTPSSVLRKKLIESGLGEAITGGGLSSELLQSTFSVGLKGVQPDKVKQVESLILETLEGLAKTGFDKEAIASSLNTIEFQVREFNRGFFPRGLWLMLGAMTKWIYDEPPSSGLAFEEPLTELKARITDHGSQVFQDAIRELLIENTHRTTVEMVPSKTLEAEQLSDEQSRLAAIKESLSEEEIEGIIGKTNELKKSQAAEDTPEDRATIPRLELSDLKREATEYPIAVTENENGSGVTVVRHELGSTSGIAYVNFGIDISGLAFEDVQLLPLFARLLTEAGAGDYDDVSLSRRIGTYTGGVSVQTIMMSVKSEGKDESEVIDGSNMITKLLLTGKATSTNTDELFSIMNLILKDARLDSRSKIIEMLKETRSNLETSIVQRGNAYVNTRMLARHTPGGYIEEKMSGISYLESVKAILEQAKNDWPSLLARLQAMRDTILESSTCRDGMFVDITGESKVLSQIQPSLEKFLEELPGEVNGSKLPNFYKEEHPWIAHARKEMSEMTPLIDEGFVVPTKVSYVGKGGILFEPGEKVSGSSFVVSRFLRTGYLWTNVRVLGGAYGGACAFSRLSGFFSCSSYRDPNLAKTLDVYDGAAGALIEAAEELEKDPDQLALAIIGAIGDLDQALNPDQKGFVSMRRWLSRETPEYRQKFRDEILNTKPADFRFFAERLREMRRPSTAVISSRTAFEEAEKTGKTFELKTVV